MTFFGLSIWAVLLLLIYGFAVASTVKKFRWEKGWPTAVAFAVYIITVPLSLYGLFTANLLIMVPLWLFSYVLLSMTPYTEMYMTDKELVDFNKMPGFISAASVISSLLLYALFQYVR